jgi:hypothetical protein
MNLPAGSAGAIVSVADYAGTWQTNNLTVVPNGTDKIGGVNASVALSTRGQSVTFIFVDSTQGWLNTMDSTSNVRASSHIVQQQVEQNQLAEILKFILLQVLALYVLQQQGHLQDQINLNILLLQAVVEVERKIILQHQQVEQEQVDLDLLLQVYHQRLILVNL